MLSTSGGVTNLEGTVTLTAAAPSGTTRVEFYVDDVLAATDTSSTFTYAWDTTLVVPGPHQLKARAYYPRKKVAQAKLDVTVLLQVAPEVLEAPVEAPPVLMDIPE